MSGLFANASPVLRLLVLALLLLRLVLQPALATTADLHVLEIDRSAACTHSLCADHGPADHHLAPVDGDGHPEALHTMLHFAHCAGSAMAVLPEAVAVTAMTPVHTTPILALTSRASRPADNPLRPPIHA